MKTVHKIQIKYLKVDFFQPDANHVLKKLERVVYNSMAYIPSCQLFDSCWYCVNMEIRVYF